MGGRRVNLIAAALALAVFYPACAAAQGLRDRDPQLAAAKKITDDLRRSTLHHGPWYLLSELHLSDIGVEQQFYVPTNEQLDGVSFTIRAPQRLYLVATKKVVFSADVVPTWAFGLRSDTRSNSTSSGRRRQNQFGYLLRSDGQFLFNHLYLDVYGQTANDLRADTSEINRLVTLKDNEIGVAGEIKYSSRTSSTFAAIRRKSDHPADRFQPFEIPVQLLDRTENNYRASLFHKTFPLTGLFVSGEASDYRFRTDRSKNGRRIFAGGGFLFDNGRSVMRVEVGKAQLRLDDPAGRDFTGTLGNISFGRRVAAHSDISLNAARDLDFSIFESNAYYVMDRAGLTTNWNATRRLTLRAGGQVGRNQYKVPVDGILRRDTYTYPWVGFLIAFHRISAGFDVGYYDRSSNFPGTEETDGIRLVLRLSFTP